MRFKLALAGGAAVAVAVAAVPAFAATKTVRVDDNVFAPKSASVRAGDTVTFRWVGDAPHNVKVTKGPVKFGSKVQRSGTYKVRLKKAGTYQIVCTIHPGMALRLRVGK
jgi:plastocyanin